MVREDDGAEAIAENEVVDDPTQAKMMDVEELIDAWERGEDEINRQDAPLQLTDP